MVTLNLDDDILNIDSFTLTASSEVSDVLKKIKIEDNEHVVFHINSFLHNTVLVQSLNKGILKKYSNAKVSFLKHSDKSKIILRIFRLKKEINTDEISAEMLNHFFLESQEKDSKIKNYRNQLFSRYFTDHLTNLPNVYQLRKDLHENEDFTLIILNIDNFQTINNFYGFIVGDYIIEKVGKYLKDNIDNHNIYRLSGDEFAFIIDYHMSFYDLKDYLNTLYEKVKNIVINYQDIKIYIDMTIASSLNRDNAHIFSKVSMALKYAKEVGAPFWIYEDRMKFESEYERNIQLSGMVRRAVENSQIVPYYQAIIDNKSSKIVKYECLARLVDDNGKVYSPVLFIPVAKKIKVYNIVTKTIIDKSFDTFENNEFEFTINLSIDDIMNGEIYKFIIEKLKNSKASSRVTFELLESEAVQDFKKVERFISEVKRYDAKIAIDDFGSGYSNFFYLTKMSADFIKIDGSLISDIDVNMTSLMVVETIVDFAKKLKVKTIAEYVHSSVVLDKVKELGIDYSQGFYIDEPSLEFK